MDINNNQHTNTFLKGMNTDISDDLLSSLEYRLAKNLRLSTNTDENSGELHLIDGVLKIIDQTINVLHLTKIRNYVVIIGKGASGTGEENKWSLWAFDNENNSFGIETNRYFGPCSEELGDDISTVCKYENEKLIKVYIADGKHLLMIVNIGKKEGFTKISEIETGLRILLNAPQVSWKGGSGNLPSPILQYAYKIYKEGFASTDVSPLSNIITAYKSYTGRGYEYKETVNNNVSVFIPNRNLLSDYNIQIFRIAYIQNGQDPQINLIYNDSLKDWKDSYYIDAGTNISELSVAEFISQTGIKFVPKVIESKNNYLFAGNIKYVQQETDEKFDKVELKLVPIIKQYRIDRINILTYGDEYGPSLKRGETYRYGVVFYLNDGTKTSVKGINDITIDRETIEEAYPNNSNYYDVVDSIDKDVYTINRIGIGFKIENVDEDLQKLIKGYEIVRCERTFFDTKNITQGIVGRPFTTRFGLLIQNESNLLVSPFMTLLYIDYSNRNTDDLEYLWSTYSDRIIMFASPEYVYMTEDLKNKLNSVKNNISLSPVQHYSIPILDGTLGDTPHSDMVGPEIKVNYDSKETKALVTISAHLPPEGNKIDKVSNERRDDRYISFSYLRACNKIALSNNAVGNLISDIEYTESPEYDKFDIDGVIRILDDSYVVGNKTFINWHAPYLYKGGSYNDTDKRYLESNLPYNFIPTHDSNPITSGKKCILLECSIGGDGATLTNDDWNSSASFGNIAVKDYIMPISVYNIKNRNVTADTVYGGKTTQAYNNNIFYSFGSYYRTDTSETYKFESLGYQVHGDHGPGSVQSMVLKDLFDGDCYIGCFIYNSAHCWNSSTYSAVMQPVIYSVPIESLVDLLALYGELYPYRNSSKLSLYFQDTPIFLDYLGLTYTLEKSAYLFNDAYITTPKTVAFSYLLYKEISSDTFDTRVLYSNQKTDGEVIDNWTQFKAANFIDVDSRFGEITHLRLFKDLLLFWQNNATGILSVNERSIVQDTNSTNIILGTGDVLLRYDYITTQYGMNEKDHSEILSDSSIYWWDRRNKELLQYTSGMLALPMNKIKNVSNYINNNDSILYPALAYDPKYNEVLFNVVKSDDIGDCIVYNENILQFTSLYNIPFEHSVSIYKDMYLSCGTSLYNRCVDKVAEAVGTQSNELFPYLKYVVNQNPQYNKVYDIAIIGGTLYEGSTQENKDLSNDTFNKYIKYQNLSKEYHTNSPLSDLQFTFYTPLNQEGRTTGNDIDNRLYDYRLNIPRQGRTEGSGRYKKWVTNTYGDRLRGKTMQCELTSNKNSTDFSLSYITTKYRISWD